MRENRRYRYGDRTDNRHPVTLARSSAWRRLVGRIVVVAAIVLVGSIAAGVPIYVTPQIDALRKADAIFVLGGNGYERYPYAIELALQGLAPRVVMSNPAGEVDVWLTDLCTNQRYPFRISCFAPDPPTTKGEAIELYRLAQAENWNTVIVVTFRPHISRARYILQQCYGGELIMSESPADLSIGYWLWAYGYQTAGYFRAAAHPEC